jgi:hypothetical protein
MPTLRQFLPMVLAEAHKATLAWVAPMGLAVLSTAGVALQQGIAERGVTLPLEAVPTTTLLHLRLARLPLHPPGLLRHRNQLPQRGFPLMAAAREPTASLA